MEAHINQKKLLAKTCHSGGAVVTEYIRSAERILGGNRGGGFGGEEGGERRRGII